MNWFIWYMDSIKASRNKLLSISYILKNRIILTYKFYDSIVIIIINYTRS